MANNRIEYPNIISKEPPSIIKETIELYKPKHIFCLFSGGHDSLVSTHVAFQNIRHRIDSVFHIDTGIGIKETQDFVKNTCQKMYWPLNIYRATDYTKKDGTPDPQLYDEMVKERGFPGPAKHTIMYNKLKGRPLALLMRNWKYNQRQRVLFISGIRAAESTIRMGYKCPVNKLRGAIFCSPIYYYSDNDCAAYIKKYDLPQNEVKKTLCISGECLCGCFAQKNERETIFALYPDVKKRIEELETYIINHKKDTFLWGERAWNSPKVRKEIENNRKDMTYEDIREMEDVLPLCSSCQYRKEAGEMGEMGKRK